jgi:rhamnopyranosyl-N-acetylglucosaminyl-diphospho-decaprenol beta-1,3/1,4-galactofuranosyltransferase
MTILFPNALPHLVTVNTIFFELYYKKYDSNGNKMLNCCAVIVTYNRKILLLECLQGLMQQTLPLEHILVVDNHSEDGTKEAIEAFSQNAANFTYMRLKENSGGAGGFHDGVKWAFDNGYEWLWLMDDDVEPMQNCLEIMAKYTGVSKCIHPTKRYTQNNKVFNWEGYFDPKTTFSHRMQEENFRYDEYTKVNMGCFEGMLIHRNIVSKIGFPDPRFFIAGDDLIYGYLASKHTDVLYLRDAEFKKKIFKEEYVYLGTVKRPYQTPFYLYFNTRNHFLKKDYVLQTGDGKRIKINIVLILKNIKLLVETLFFFRSYQHLKMFTLGLIDGLNRNFKGHKRFIS